LEVCCQAPLLDASPFGEHAAQAYEDGDDHKSVADPFQESPDQFKKFHRNPSTTRLLPARRRTFELKQQLSRQPVKEHDKGETVPSALDECPKVSHRCASISSAPDAQHTPGTGSGREPGGTA